MLRYDEYLDKLTKRGFVVLGRGMWSQVLGKPGSDRVIKLCRSVDGWPEYVIWATENGFAGQQAPKVYSIHKINDYYYSATMERLFPINSKNDVKREELNRQVRRRNPEDPFIQAYQKRFGEVIDGHGTNWMQRANDELVLTDPIADSLASKLPRKFRSP